MCVYLILGTLWECYVCTIDSDLRSSHNHPQVGKLWTFIMVRLKTNKQKRVGVLSSPEKTILFDSWCDQPGLGNDMSLHF